MMASHSNGNMEQIMDVSVASSFGSPIMFNPSKRGLEASAGVLKDILLGEPHNISGNNNNESFHSNADFEDLDHMPKLRNTYNCPLPGGVGPFPTHHSTRQRSSRSANPVHNSNLDLRRVGSQMNRPQSHSPARGRCLPSATRRYSPPQGSTGSGGTKSPDTMSPKTSWEHGPISTSSPMSQRRHGFRGAPYYVSDTVPHGRPHDSSLDGPSSFYIDHNSSGGSTAGPTNVFPSFPMHPNSRHHHHMQQQSAANAAAAAASRQHFADLSMQAGGMYDESMYRLLPHGLAPAGVGGGGGLGPHAPPHATSIDSCLLAAATGACYGMTDEELQREYAVVLDALNGGPSAAAAAAAGGNPCCNAACHQIAAESPREQTLGCGSGFGAGYNPHTTGPYYTNWGLQTCCQPVGPGFESRLIPGPGGQVQGQHVATHHSVETCVDDEIPCEIIESGVSSEEMVSSWTGICGVPGLGYSLRPQEGCDLETCQLAANTAQQVQDILNSEPEWSANSAQNLASLKVDLPRVNHHDLVRSRTVSVQQERSGQPRETASKQPNSASKSHSSSSHSGGSVSGYNGVSAVSHLMSDSVNFERHNPASKSSNAKRPLRATVASRLRSKVSLPASWPSDNSGHSGSDKGPNSLPTQFIPRAPIPTPEILAAARSSSNKASNSKQNIVTQQKNREITTVQTSATATAAAAGSGPNSNPHHLSSGQPVHSISGQNNKSQQDSFSANNEAILKQDQIYKSPKERDGDYSYAYDCSISPAVVIKWNEEDEGDSDFDLEETESDQDLILQEPQNAQPKPLPPVRRNQQVSSSNSREKTHRQKKKHLPKKRSSKESTNKDAENIYEEIEDVKAQSASSSVNNSDSGIGGLIGNNPDHKSLNSYGSSSAKSSSGSAGGSAGIPMSKGTLDVSRPGRHKKSSNAEQSAAAERSERAKRIAETRASAEARGSTGIPLSSLDALLSQTSPALTAHQRLSLRKSLVDELFEELIQRHHRRVLDELRLDVEEFIAPSPDFFDQPSATENSSNSNSTPKSSRSSANQSCSKLHRCESMDFKSADQNSRSSKNNAENSAGLFKANNNGGSGNNNGTEPNKKIGSKLWQSARKCTEVIQRKLKKSPSTQFEQQNQQQLDLAGTTTAAGAAVNVGHGSISSPSTKPIQANAAVAPPVSLGPFLNRTQVTRRGHRPLSAIVSSSQNNNNYNKKSGSKHAQAAPVIDTLEDDLSDNEQDAADRRLLRSKIIKSFWEQHDQEGGDFSEPEVGSDKR